MDRFESMSALVAAAEAGSLSAAARRLGMPLPTLSRKVSELEDHLGTRLLNRSSRQLTLTDTGRSYIAACKRILEEIQDAERAATGEYSSPKGDLVIAAPIVFGRIHVLPIVVEFLCAYPDIDIRIVLSDRVTNLLEEHIDLALRVGELPDSSLTAVRIGTIRRVVCGSPAYFAKRGMPKRIEDLRQHDCITFEGLTSPRSWIFKGRKSKTAVTVHSRLVVNTAEAAIDAAISGLGITRVFSYQIAEAERLGKLRRILDSLDSDATPVHLVYSGQPLLPLKLRSFLDFAAPLLKSRLERIT